MGQKSLFALSTHKKHECIQWAEFRKLGFLKMAVYAEIAMFLKCL
jgi:hypothetical protein